MVARATSIESRTPAIGKAIRTSQLTGLRPAVPSRSEPSEKRNALFAVASTAAFTAHASINYVPSVLDQLGIKSAFPVGPKGEARIRVQLSAQHTEQQVDQAIAAFATVGKRLGVLKS